MNELNMRNYAHIGDAVWELFVREYTIFKTQNSNQLHKITTERVNSSYQEKMLSYIEPKLSEKELELSRRAHNCPIPVARRSNQKEYRHATSFEALIGYWYLNDKNRYNEIINDIKNEFFSE